MYGHVKQPTSTIVTGAFSFPVHGVSSYCTIFKSAAVGGKSHVSGLVPEYVSGFNKQSSDELVISAKIESEIDQQKQIIARLEAENKDLSSLINYLQSSDFVEKEARGNAQALEHIKDKTKNSFVVMSGDTYNDFDLLKMIKQHLEIDKMATMGLMTREKTSGYGIAILDGDFIVDFQEKPKQSSTNIVNAGIYIFKPEVFELFENVSSLEKDLFPKLARLNQLIGFFTYGEYKHLG